ncbi:hypothetical protein ONA91_36195 [Micromonospora sp. DR5-3]|uniref:hypothetical protein n=1 Tax=unclassified Micromonospora TaxID=2617518 RepID=UPI002106300F|nr:MULTISPECIES: hypothetical protein [unclassified Micromonospora]MCW3819893.1 hypothetical protein [Micromonospora sp. DR5-3]
MASLLALLVATVIVQVGVMSTPGLANTSQFKGANWADPRDNYAEDLLSLSVLSTTDGYATTYTKATGIISGFQNNLGANTMRLPINPYTVNGSYWASYTGVPSMPLSPRASRSSSATGRVPPTRTG